MIYELKDIFHVLHITIFHVLALVDPDPCWYLQVSFETLDPEQMNNTTMKYAKSVMQLEKGLPPNGVVPMLKERVETMRDRVGHSGAPERGIKQFCYM